jgi:uncharacterized protein YodC (DUF2158 family)
VVKAVGANGEVALMTNEEKEKKESERKWEETRSKFAKGTKVQLTVGGPLMAVNGYGGLAHHGQIECHWFSGKKLESGYFAPETLVLVKEDGGGEKQS